jgi:cellulose synthase/poly-beta-1,6-N-acetylglucosamine synthase-like glycosyltransferase/peptidoglycan/xylan/chitin deacetylase (PgdA/CDA1 family)/spore germination protein YaaH
MRKIREVPIFFDPNRKRWPRLRQGVFLSGFIMTCVFGVLIMSVLVNPYLPDLKLPNSTFLPSPGHPTSQVIPPLETPRQQALREAKQKLEKERKLRAASMVQQVPVRANTGQPLSIGFYVNWDEASMTSLRENFENPDTSLDIVIGEFEHLKDAAGNLAEDAPDRQKIATDDVIRAHKPQTKIMALVNNFDREKKLWDGQMLAEMLARPEARASTIKQLLNYVQGHNFTGVSIDFESVHDDSQSNLNEFMTELAVVFHPAGLAVSMNVPANNDSFDYKKLSSPVDFLILMVYDQHWAPGKPGPIAGADWISDILKLRQMDVPAEKMVIGIGNYAYDWAGEKEPDIRTFEEAILTASESSGDTMVNVHLDPDSLNPTFEYDEQDLTHQVWMLDAVTAFNAMAISRQFQPRGFALWRLGSEDPSIWSFFGRNAPLDGSTASKMTAMRYGYALPYEGNGEILRITYTPSEGLREIFFDTDRSVITAEHIKQFPRPYVITRYGAVDHKLALTFDDGPDPNITPKILDVLKQERAPATFFCIGLNSEERPDLIRRMIAEGHEIGNHTFTHPNIADISATQLRLELSATQRLFESVIGRRSMLFRPPYAEDSEPDTTSEVAPLEDVTAKGYLTIGMQIDPKDWERPPADQIVDETIKQAAGYIDKDGKRIPPKGNIILLHDSGGDRSQTIKALPILIDKLRAQGFEFVTVSALMGKSRDDVMPPIPPKDRWAAWANGVAFTIVNVGIKALNYLFLVGIFLGIARLAFIGALAIVERWQERHATYDPNYSPTVAVIVPAYNEEKVILQTITSLLASDHPPGFEIVIVDDGSTDETYARVVEAFSEEPRVRAFCKANGGKASALNYGVARTDAEIIVALDADTLFARDTISKLVRHFCNGKVGAVAGNAKVGNRINLLTRWQALEYITSQNLDRRAFEALNCITVVPGAVGAWRRDLLIEAGGFTHLTLAEDADLTMTIRKLGYSIAYEDEAIGLTEAPDTVRAFVRQRFRWMYGTLQAAWKHHDALFRPRYGSLGFIALPNIFVFQVFFPLISPVMDLVMIGTVVSAALDRWQHPAEFSSSTLLSVLFFYALFLAADFLSAGLAFLLEPEENRRLLVWLFLQRFFYRQLMYYVAIKSTLAGLKGISVGWSKLERKATVRAET